MFLYNFLCCVLCSVPCWAGGLGNRPNRGGTPLIRPSTRAGGESMHSPACARAVPGTLGRGGYCVALCSRGSGAPSHMMRARVLLRRGSGSMPPPGWSLGSVLPRPGSAPYSSQLGSLIKYGALRELGTRQRSVYNNQLHRWIAICVQQLNDSCGVRGAVYRGGPATRDVGGEGLFGVVVLRGVVF
jgi:hypothetical protein